MSTGQPRVALPGERCRPVVTLAITERVDPTAARALWRLLFGGPSSPAGQETAGYRNAANRKAAGSLELPGREVRP